MAGIALPPALMARAFAPAWGIAIAAHLVLLGLALRPAAPPPAEEPLVRMVFLEPPPPPPAPLGMPSGAGQQPALVEPRVPSPVVVAKKRPTVVPVPPRIVKAKPKPATKPPVVEEPKPQVAPAEVAPGVAAGVAGGPADGVVGGVTGGLAGGVVGGSGSEAVPVGTAAQPPVLTHRVQPHYPQQARRQQVHGLVLLEAVLDRDGRVEPGVKVLQSIPMLDDEAIAAVRRWRFKPARSRSGDPLRVIVEIPIRFVLR